MLFFIYPHIMVSLGITAVILYIYILLKKVEE